ncbi:MAG: helix-turn-helix transcriptional regulator [Bacillota bacterium]
MERFIQPCLLLLLYEKPSHGYELLERLNDYGFEYSLPDTGAVYRNLRNMEDDGLVSSDWDVDQPGPARRLYSLTPRGVGAIHTWAAHARGRVEVLERFLDRYEQLFPGPGSKDSG